MKSFISCFESFYNFIFDIISNLLRTYKKSTRNSHISFSQTHQLFPSYCICLSIRECGLYTVRVKYFFEALEESTGDVMPLSP